MIASFGFVMIWGTKKNHLEGWFWLFCFRIPIEKESEITSALERVRATEDIFPRFGVAASDGDLSRSDKRNKILGTVGIGIFERFRAEPFLSARERIRAIVQNVLDIARKIIEGIRDFLDLR